MIRTETYLDGRLVKVIDQVDVMTAQTMRHEYVDGRHRWLLDGDEITEDEARTALADAGQIGPVQVEINAGADVMAMIVDDLIDEALRPE